MKVMHSSDLESACCCFKDIAQLDGLQSECARHGQLCQIPTDEDGPHVLSAGFSCKNFSRLFSRRGEFGQAVSKSQGSSGVTAQGLIKHVGTHTPMLLILENVPELLDPSNKENLSALLTELKNHGYAIKAGSSV